MQIGAAKNGAPASRQDDVLVITLSGAITAETYGVTLERLGQEVSERPVRALVIDLTRAAPLSEWADGWQASEDFCLVHSMPCGLVVLPEMLLPIRHRCFRVSAIGVTWIAFLRLRDAVEWASTRSWSGAVEGLRQPPPSPSGHPTPPLLH